MLRKMAIVTSPPEESDSFAFLDGLASEFEDAYAEMAESTEKELAGRTFVFSSYGRELYPYFEATDADQAPGCILPIKEGRPVASVDSTCILIGETAQGALYAARTAVGISYEGSLRRFFRLGPILVYASPSGLSGLSPSIPESEMDFLLSDPTVAERYIRNNVERRVIATLAKAEENLIVMADGSLRHPMGQIASPFVWRTSGRCLVGFSKSSNLIMNEGAMSVLAGAPRPSYLVMDNGAVSTVLAKFTRDGLVFRLDLAGAEAVEAILGRILWNDAFSSGYPESLKVAHHLSIFSRAEGQALKALVAKRFRVRQLHAFPLRKVALGSFRGSA